jgi:alpha-L-fucosidase 2
MRKLVILLGLFSIIACNNRVRIMLPGPEQNMVFTELAKVWDEAIPLGNGIMGSLVWEKDGHLRFSLDRSDLWDLRPIVYLQQDEFSFDWVYEKWKKDEYQDVQALFDAATYSQSIAPSKIPGAALEFWFEGMDSVVKAELNISDATCTVEWANGLKLETFIQADQPIGYFKFTGMKEKIRIKLLPPVYQKKDSGEQVNEVTGQELTRLGYEQGEVVESGNRISYHQKGWKDFYYDVVVDWEEDDDVLKGSWSVSSSIAERNGQPSAKEVLDNQEGFKKSQSEHSLWWSGFWSASSINIPDPVLEKQWYLEQYKFGSAARENTPPISLQAVWTADNGRMPPWKGDFHHDLNTQLSYWPAYSANHLDLEKGFLNWLWEIKPVAEAYTDKYFGVEGLNVPGVSTLEGEPMGGWIQYSCGPTVSAWLAHHFYLHWRYTLDRVFLEERAYPWLRDVAVFLENFSVFNDEGMRKLPLSSSPEIHNNSREAWFPVTTNFDLALIRFTFSKAAELADELGLRDEADHWEKILSQWPGFSVDETGLNFAPGEPYQESHRHFSHLMAWHPLGLIDWSEGDEDREIILNTLSNLEKYGPDWWTGYSYSWLGNLYARAFMGNKAANALRDFANCFCLKNSFHVNGDQCKAGKSKFTYRPFTLEGNFAFASGIQEMLMQSHTGIIRIFPAIPEEWKNVSFNTLRTEGGFLVSAVMEEGRVVKAEIIATVDGKCRILNPNDKKTVDEYIMNAGEVKAINY